MKKSYLSLGPLALDKVHTMWVVVTSDPYSRADEVRVEASKTVADWESNKRFPNDDPVVDTRMVHNIGRGEEMCYTYPISRLHIVEEVNEELIGQKVKYD